MINFTPNFKVASSRQTLVIVLSIALVPLISLLVLLVSCSSQESANSTISNSIDSKSNSINRLLVVTATNELQSETFQRFNRSIKANDLDLIILGPSDENVSSANQLSGKEKLERLRKALAIYKSEPDLILILVDAHNALINGNRSEILDRFANFKLASKIVIAADSICWPDSSLESKYPPISSNEGERFLNSGLVIGYAPFLWDLFNQQSQQQQEEDDNNNNNNNLLQTHLTSVYLNAESRLKLGIELDHRAELFQTLSNSMNEGQVELEMEPQGVKLRNTVYQSEPLIVQASGTSQITLNSLGNYLGKAWTSEDGCRWCNESFISLASIQDEDLPSVLVGLFIEEPTPFIDDFFLELRNLKYPKKKLHLFVHNSIEYHSEKVRSFTTQFGSQYASLQLIETLPPATSNQNDTIVITPEAKARNDALELCLQLNCDYYLALDSIARLELPETLRLLIEANKTIVAPMLSRPGKLWSNFWGALSSEGFYARSHDYVDLVKRDRVGLWSVAHLAHAYLLNGRFIRRSLEQASKLKVHLGELKSVGQQLPRLSYWEPEYSQQHKPAMTFTKQIRLINWPMYMLNTHEFGHLIDPTSFNTSLVNPDFYQLANNMEDWETHYLHDNFTQVLEEGSAPLEQPCRDVFWFPLVSDRFTLEITQIMEAYGRWSGGTNDDPRIEGGYESVPTRDIHLKQVGLHEMWLLFLKEYVMPVQLKEYIGYEHDPPRADLAFVVRYHPEEQSSLRPHHDASTYTLNIALNSPESDYQGGGCRFVRYNCSVTQSRRGWALMHPGRLTHYHEGLPVTSGTRYILVTFIDP